MTLKLHLTDIAFLKNLIHRIFSLPRLSIRRGPAYRFPFQDFFGIPVFPFFFSSSIFFLSFSSYRSNGASTGLLVRYLIPFVLLLSPVLPGRRGVFFSFCSPFMAVCIIVITHSLIIYTIHGSALSSRCSVSFPPSRLNQVLPFSTS